VENSLTCIPIQWGDCTKLDTRCSDPELSSLDSEDEELLEEAGREEEVRVRKARRKDEWDDIARFLSYPITLFLDDIPLIRASQDDKAYSRSWTPAGGLMGI